jgi:two-component system response regulator FlrC
MLNVEVKLVGSHPKFEKAVNFAKSIAVTKSPALIQGEVGVGKRTLCRFIHQNSARANAPYTIVDCSLDHTEVERQILGHRNEDGRFIKGALENSNRGTVVLAHVDSMDEVFQKRLYQIITELSDYDLDIRILATTTKNLSKLVGAGRFYRALYTFFSTSHITIPPLRERSVDVQEIAQYQLSLAGDDELKLDPIAIDKLTNYYWTHNVEELINVLKESIERTDGNTITADSIQLGERKNEISADDSSEDTFRLMSLKEAEKLLIKKALIHTSENRTQAAKILGVSIRTLRNKINEYRNDGSSYFVNLR